MEKLSVVVPVYNVYPYLRECLDSIINQTYKNLEIIIVNDASPYKEDDEICREYAAKDERIKYIVHEVNKGLGGGRNTGIDNATGKYITFVDSDDYINDINLFLKIIESFKKKNVNFISYGVIQFKELEQNKLKLAERKLTKPIRIDENIKISELAWNKVFLLEDIKNKVYFEEHLKYEDFIFWYKYILTVKPVGYYINSYCYMYRIRENSIMGNYNNMKERFTAFNIVYEFIKNNGYEKEYKNHFVKWLEYPENYRNFSSEVKSIYSQEAIKFINKIQLKSHEIRELLNFKFYIMFMDESVTDLYLETVRPWKKIKYKIASPNIIVYKIKREIKNIINKIKII